jgi:hypothetical protein
MVKLLARYTKRKLRDDEGGWADRSSFSKLGWSVGCAKIFLPQDAELILATPVQSDLDDLVAWHYDTKGIFRYDPPWWKGKGGEKQHQK